MEAARYDFPVRRGDTEVLAVILDEQDPFTLEYRPYLKAGDVVVWTQQFGSAEATTKTTAPGGGLIYDPITHQVSLPLSAADTAALPASTPVRYAIKRQGGAGGVDTFLEGVYLITGP